MALSLKELSKLDQTFAPGHRLCAGCAESIIVRQVLMAAGDPVVVANATGCLEVATSIYPFTSWRVSWIHSAFENAASTISGVETAYRSLVKQGKMEDVGMKFIVFGGDGATYDIGLQFLSGALERGHRFLYVCLNNEAYMNTGIQRSGSTPRGTWTTTSPVGEAIVGKREYPKDMTAIVAAHGIPYVAQAVPSQWRDLMTKVQKAIAANGPTFINVLSSRLWTQPIDSTAAGARSSAQARASRIGSAFSCPCLARAFANWGKAPAGMERSLKRKEENSSPPGSNPTALATNSFKTSSDSLGVEGCRSWFFLPIGWKVRLDP